MSLPKEEDLVHRFLLREMTWEGLSVNSSCLLCKVSCNQEGPVRQEHLKAKYPTCQPERRSRGLNELVASEALTTCKSFAWHRLCHDFTLETSIKILMAKWCYQFPKPKILCQNPHKRQSQRRRCADRAKINRSKQSTATSCEIRETRPSSKLHNKRNWENKNSSAQNKIQLEDWKILNIRKCAFH